MQLSKEILSTIQSDLEFINLDDIFSVIDTDYIQNNKGKLVEPETLYWIDSDYITDQIITKAKGIVLIGKNTFKEYLLNNVDHTRLIISQKPESIIKAVNELLYRNEFIHTIHKSAVVHPKAKIGLNVHVGAFSVLDECTIGDNTIIHENCFIGNGVIIGNDSEIHNGARIGLSVFGFRKSKDGEWIKHHHFGSVKIGDHVTIGSNSCINNGFIDNTSIEDGAFIDNLCHIGSSAFIGSGSIIAANSFIAQHTKIGRRCWISASVTIRENVSICDDAFIGIGSTVLKSIKKKGRYFGYPASVLPE